MTEDVKPKPRNFGKAPAYGPPQFDHFELQARYPGNHGWEDVTAETSLEQIMQRREEYMRDMPEYPYRVVTVSNTGRRKVVKIDMSHLYGKVTLN